ncbi:apc amino acid permease [Stylonychia lemnae]|uniref:Apc amino acid permease n=1 Tax=Stylonychia lemnae TaxID=5949 RepID=A0A078B1Q0_STYLE|nr:apc amino acid permease [Stylonychia lemnae]|eukprot:CDW88429.1 apc amino acid permease [Stylonychia lemnae]
MQKNIKGTAEGNTSKSQLDEDDQILAKMGYKQELYRGFNAFMSFSFCFTAVAVISGCSILFPYGLKSGGPVIMIWGWIIGSVFTIICGLSMAEICSSYPSAGSVYHWAGMMAPPKWAPFASYICGWFNFLGNAASDASFAFGFAQVVSAAIHLGTRGDIEVPVIGQVGLAVAVSFLWALKNIMRVDHQGWFNNASAIYQLTSTFVVVIVLLIVSPRLSSSDFVWTQYNNGSNLPNVPYSCCIGLLMCLFSFSGYEGGAHMAEETKNASSSAPWGIVYTCLASAFTGIIYITGLLYSCQNYIQEILDGNSDQAVVNIYALAFTDSNGHVKLAGSLILTVMLIINLFFAGFSSMTVTSRIGFAMARDGGLPLSSYLYKLNPRTLTPDRIIFLVFLMDVALCLLPLISQTAFAAITSITTIGYQISYAIPIVLRLTVCRNTFQKSAFHLGNFSEVIGWISVVWLCVTSVFFLLPSEFDENGGQNAKIFNYTCVVVGGTLLLAMIYWFLPAPHGARHFFVGPKRDDVHRSKVDSENQQALLQIEIQQIKIDSVKEQEIAEEDNSRNWKNSSINSDEFKQLKKQ